jgi:hypothetical protein
VVVDVGKIFAQVVDGDAGDGSGGEIVQGIGVAGFGRTGGMTRTCG